eukprot:m.31662 g.31662  ORF g.31662 m.31662 type:complete len:301 (-) comp5385_c0_seq1:419-1321(-)
MLDLSASSLAEWLGAMSSTLGLPSLSIAHVGLALAAPFAALAVWRWADLRCDEAEMRRLRAFAADNEALKHFDPSMVAKLPSPVRRYFEASISPGTPLYQVVELTMTGLFDLGTRDERKPMAMTAKQVTAGLNGFVWQASMPPISGSDSATWTRFWLGGLFPVARVGGKEDHRRAAFGRTVVEAVLWLPTSVLPREGITWEEVDEHTARVTVVHDGLQQSVDLTLDDRGHAVQAVLLRWSDANPQHVFQPQPFGGILSDHRNYGGLTIPAHAEVGNHFGTENYFPFFISDLQSVSFPSSP